MAKIKVVNTVLHLRDEMSGGLVKIAKNTRRVAYAMQEGAQGIMQFRMRAQASIAAVTSGLNKLQAAAEDAFAVKIGLSAAFGLEGFRRQLGAVAEDCLRVGRIAGEAAALVRKASVQEDARLAYAGQPDMQTMRIAERKRCADNIRITADQSYNRAFAAWTNPKAARRIQPDGRVHTDRSLDSRKDLDALMHAGVGAAQSVRSLSGGIAALHGKLGKLTKTARVLLSDNPAVCAADDATTAGMQLLGHWRGLENAAGRLHGGVKAQFIGIKNSIVNAFREAKQEISGFFPWINAEIKQLMLPSGSYVYRREMVGGAMNWIGSAFGRNALGTSYWRGGLTRVHERGGEIMNLPSGTQIIPHDVSMRMAGGPQVSVQVVVQGNVIGNRQFADEMGETIWERIRKALDNM